MAIRQLARVAAFAVVVLSLGVANGERKLDEIVFSKEQCGKHEDMGDFDVCGSVELCEGNVENERRERHLRKSNTPKAAFGYRLPNTGGCSFPGPTMRLQRGKKHGLIVRNASSRNTNVHLHGLHIGSESSGDSVLRLVEPSASAVYAIDLPEDAHLGGTHWYHPHLKGEAWDQTRGGAFGMIIVDDDGHDVGTKDANVLAFLADDDTNKLLLLDFGTLQRETWFANGLQSEQFDLIAHQWYRFRILVVDSDSHVAGGDLQFDQDRCDVRPLAHDGILRFQVPGPLQWDYYVASATRLDVAIRCNEVGDSSINIRDTPVALLNVQDGSPSAKTPFNAGNEEGGTWDSQRLSYLQDLRQSPVTDSQEIRVDETNINNLRFDSEPLCQTDGDDFHLGEVIEWELKGVNTHPFHTHVYPMQVVSETGCGDAHTPGEFYDTIFKHNSDYFDSCIVRIHLADVTGPAMLHCHIFQHVEQGAITFFNVMGTQPSGDHDNVSHTRKKKRKKISRSSKNEEHKFPTCNEENGL